MSESQLHPEVQARLDEMNPVLAQIAWDIFKGERELYFNTDLAVYEIELHGIQEFDAVWGARDSDQEPDNSLFLLLIELMDDEMYAENNEKSADGLPYVEYVYKHAFEEKFFKILEDFAEQRREWQLAQEGDEEVNLLLLESEEEVEHAYRDWTFKTVLAQFATQERIMIQPEASPQNSSGPGFSYAVAEVQD